jgi:hypothetical protein
MIGMVRVNRRTMTRQRYPSLIRALVDFYLLTVWEMRVLKFYWGLDIETAAIDLLFQINIKLATLSFLSVSPHSHPISN